MPAPLTLTKNSEAFTYNLVSKPGSTAATILSIAAVVVAIVSLAIAIILILGATGALPTVASLIAISSLGISLGLGSALTVLSTIFLILFVSTIALAILLIKYARDHDLLVKQQTTHFTQPTEIEMKSLN